MELLTSFSTLQDALESDVPKSVFLKDEAALNIDPRIASVKNLKSLYLVNSQWTVIPLNGIDPVISIYNWDPNIFSVPAIEDLRVINFYVSSVPQEITKLPKLRYLQLCISPHSDCSFLTAVLRRMDTLETLNLSGSFITMDEYNSIKHELSGITVIFAEHQIGK